MGWTRGKVTQTFSMRIDLEKLMDYINENITQAIRDAGDFSEVDVEWSGETELELSGSYETKFRSYYASATLYEPEEYDMEREMLSGTEKDLVMALPEPLRNLIDIVEIEEREEGADYKVPEPDEDAIYDAWKDRQLEED